MYKPKRQVNLADLYKQMNVYWPLRRSGNTEISMLNMWIRGHIIVSKHQPVHTYSINSLLSLCRSENTQISILNMWIRGYVIVSTHWSVYAQSIHRWIVTILYVTHFNAKHGNPWLRHCQQTLICLCIKYKQMNVYYPLCHIYSISVLNMWIRGYVIVSKHWYIYA